MTSCLICKNEATLLYLCPKTYILNELKSLYRLNDVSENPFDIHHDYVMRRCDSCHLVFADPPLPGSEVFYNTITNMYAYYPKARWDWKKALAWIKDRSIGEIIDIGGGDGSFLEFLSNNGISNGLLTLLDTSEVSCRKAAENGFKTLRKDMNHTTNNLDRKYDFITLFHVLEHVSDPVGVVTQLKGVLNDQGEIIISVPLSPMDYEGTFFDVLNHPPHHITQWNEKALASLAKKTNMQYELRLQPNSDLIRRTYTNMKLLDPDRTSILHQELLFSQSSSKVTKILYMMRFSANNPIKTVKILWAQIMRTLSGNKGNVILLRLWNLNNDKN